MKKLLTLVLTLGLLLSVTACGSSEQNGNEEKTDGNEVEKTTYIVGFDNAFAPMVFEKDGENQGFDIDLAKKMEAKLGVTFEFQPIDWTLKETELTSKNIDMIWNGYSITPARQEKVLFSEPYMKNRILVIVNKDSGIKNFADLKNKIVSTQGESSALEALNNNDLSKELAEIVTYASYNDVFNDLKTERCDAIAVDETLGLYQIKTAGEQDLYTVLDEDLGSEEYGVGFRKEDTEFVDKFNKALKELKDEGEIDKIYQKWFE